MKQPTIRIKDVNGKDYGIKNVTQLNWSRRGNISSIVVDFMGDGRDLMFMMDYDSDGIFRNQFNNLEGKLEI